MRLSDITVEVRDRNLARIGVIRHEDLDITVEDYHNNVGNWKLNLAAEHPMASVLRERGSGIIVTGPSYTLFSGPRTGYEFKATPEDPRGSIEFTGVSDDVILSDYLAFPQPSNPNPTTQTAVNDKRTGPVETLMHGYVKDNLGPDAPVARRKANFLMGTNDARGETVTKTARFKQIGTLLTELAGKTFGFRVIQRDDKLKFETFLVDDRSPEIRFDARNGTLAGSRQKVDAPTATRVLVAGENEGTKRRFVEVTNSQTATNEAEYGRRIERFLDQRQAEEDDELTKAGKEVMEEEGEESVVAQAVPAEDSTMKYGVDWRLGDKVAVVIDNDDHAVRCGVCSDWLAAVSGPGCEPLNLLQSVRSAGHFLRGWRRLYDLQRAEPEGSSACWSRLWSDRV